MFLVNSRQAYFRCNPSCEGQALSLTYGRFFAEFLKEKSLVPLGLLALSTCVGLRYGANMFLLIKQLIEVFLESRFIEFGRGEPQPNADLDVRH